MSKLSRKNKFKLISILSIIFVLLNIITYIFISNNKEAKIKMALDGHLDRLKINYEILDHHQELTANAAYISTIGMKKVIEIMSKAEKANTNEQKNILRKQLYNILIKKYNILKTKGVLQYQFILSNNESFLRLHKPNKFGDNLSDIRKDFVYTNKNLKPIRGFSQGKTTHGFRNIYPIFDKNKKYIGAMEVSFSSESIQKELNTISKLHTHFIVDKKIYSKKTWKRDDFITKYSQSAEHKDYLITMANYHDTRVCILDGQKSLKKLKVKIDKNIQKGDKFSLYHKYNNSIRVISFLPIQNIEKTKTAAWLVSYEKNNFINITLQTSFVINIAISIILILIFYFIYIVINQKEMLDIQVKEKTKELKIQIDIAQNAAKAKSEFLANMSHEIRTPLNAVLGFIDLLKEETKGIKSEQYVDIIDKSSKSLLQIIEDILDFSKIDSGKLDIDKINFNSKAEFEVITHLFDAKCSQKNISLTLNIDKKLPQIINTDPLRTKQVIANLISNAVKFTNNGKSIIVDIDYKDNLLLVSVKDQGIGISKDKLKHIFEAFSQEDSSTTRKYGGTGLGLSISSKLIKLLGGELKVKSEVGIGSEFYFCIPISIGKELKTEILQSKNIDFINKKILLVEDNKANQLFMKVILKKLNLTSDIANDGVEAVDMFKLDNYDLILMDENMPNMSGIEATKKILEIEKKLNLPHTPIIALTANAIKGDRERFLSAGMDEYMTKPVDKIKLAKILENYLVKKS